jgi:hypothetical protein
MFVDGSQPRPRHRGPCAAKQGWPADGNWTQACRVGSQLAQATHAPCPSQAAPTATRGEQTELESHQSRTSSQSSSPFIGSHGPPADERRWHVRVTGSQTRDSAQEIDAHEAPTVVTSGWQINELVPGGLVQVVPV